MAGPRHPAGLTLAWYLIAVLLLAGVSGVGWGLSNDTRTGLSVAAGVLLAGAPIALLLVRPVSMLRLRRLCRGEQIRFGDAAAVELAAGADTIVLDPDGTVTTGQLKVRTVVPFDADHDRNLRWFAGALAHGSDTLVGRAIARLSTRGRITGVTEEPGLGVSGFVDRHPVRVGDTQWLGSAWSSLDPADLPSVWPIVGVEVDGRPLGTIRLGPDVWRDAQQRVKNLAALGKRVVLISPAPDEQIFEVATACGVVEYHADSNSVGAGSVIEDFIKAGALLVVDDRIEVNEPAVADNAPAAVRLSALGLPDRRISTISRALLGASAAVEVRRSVTRWAATGGLLATLPMAARVLPMWSAPPLAVLVALLTVLAVQVHPGWSPADSIVDLDGGD